MQSTTLKLKWQIEFVKKRIEQAAFFCKRSKSAEWNIEDHILHLIINEEKCSIQDGKSHCKVGHDTDDIKSTDEDYQNLHGC